MAKASDYVQHSPIPAPDRSRVTRWRAIGWAVTLALFVAAVVRIMAAG